MTRPTLNALRAFEGVARLGRFTLAAEELGVSHGAVSRQIKALEAALEIRLFEGPKTRLALTAEGRALAAELSPAFAAIAAGVAKLDQGGRELTVACHATISARWLIPRLGDFHAAQPALRVALSELASAAVSAPEARASIRILREPPRPPLKAAMFMENWLGVVVAPGLAQGGLAQGGLEDAPRLGSTSAPQGWDEWRTLSGRAWPDRPVQRFARMHYMLQAAVAGQGAAVASWPLVADDVAAGRLVAPLGFVKGEGGYALISRGDPDAATRRLLAWLRSQAARLPAPERDPSGDRPVAELEPDPPSAT